MNLNLIRSPSITLYEFRDLQFRFAFTINKLVPGIFFFLQIEMILIIVNDFISQFLSIYVFVKLYKKIIYSFPKNDISPFSKATVSHSDSCKILLWLGYTTDWDKPKVCSSLYRKIWILWCIEFNECLFSHHKPPSKHSTSVSITDWSSSEGR